MNRVLGRQTWVPLKRATGIVLQSTIMRTPEEQAEWEEHRKRSMAFDAMARHHRRNRRGIDGARKVRARLERLSFRRVRSFWIEYGYGRPRGGQP